MPHGRRGEKEKRGRARFSERGFNVRIVCPFTPKRSKRRKRGQVRFTEHDIIAYIACSFTSRCPEKSALAGRGPERTDESKKGQARFSVSVEFTLRPIPSANSPAASRQRANREQPTVLSFASLAPSLHCAQGKSALAGRRFASICCSSRKFCLAFMASTRRVVENRRRIKAPVHAVFLHHEPRSWKCLRHT